MTDRRGDAATDLTRGEQRNVRGALHYLRRRIGSWQAVADALDLKIDTVEQVANERRTATPRTAFRVARLLDVSIDDLLTGHALPGTCPQCGYRSDFADEPTVVDDGPPPPMGGGGLKLIK